VARAFIGASAGSGGDGVDLALVETEGVGLNLTARVLHSLRYPLPREFADRFDRVFRAESGSWHDLASAHRVLAETAGGGVLQLLRHANADWGRVNALGWLGPTAWQCSSEGGTVGYPFTLESGSAAVIAERTGITTVADFRARDLAAGGTGSPAAALADWLSFRSTDEDRVLIHLGGAASVVFLPRSGRAGDIVAFEAGPCDRWLDGLIRHWTAGRERFDPGGRHAVQGRCLAPLLDRWMAHPFFARKPPKAMGRGEFAEALFARAGEQARQHDGSLQDLLCTATHLVVRCVADAIARWLPPADEFTFVYLTGGGTRNGMLLQLLGEAVNPCEVRRLDALGVPARARTPAGAAVLAALALDGVAASSPTLTGATGGRVLGHFSPGDSRNWAKCLAWMASQQSAEWEPRREAA